MFVWFVQATSTCEMSILRGLLDEEKYKVDRQEDQINDLTELHQNEITNLKQVSGQNTGLGVNTSGSTE